jgi:general secretion pathway protein G
MKTARAFTLVEILIVVVVLGILAATVITMASSSTLSAKESAVATDLQLLRNFILIYKAQHLEVSPGYPNGSTSVTPTSDAFVAQATTASNSSGVTAAVGTSGYERGPYMQMIPVNPLNNSRSVMVVAGTAFPNADNSTGWVYLPELSQIRVNASGTDSTGKSYYDY